MKARHLIFILGLGLATPLPTFAQSPSEDTAAEVQNTVNPAVAERVEVMLSGIEFEPTRTQWIALGADAPRVLAEVVGDTDAPVVKRARAIVALVHFEYDSAAMLEGMLTDAKTPSILLRKSIWALARIAGDDAVDSIEPHLEHPTLAVREEAVEALGHIASLPARNALKGRLSTEKSEYLKKKIQSVIVSTGAAR